MNNKTKQEVVVFLKSQLELYQKNLQKGEEIAYQIAGMASDDTIRLLPSDDPIRKIIFIAGELELPEEHRSADVTWRKMSEQIEEL